MNSAREFANALNSIPFGTAGSEDRELYRERQNALEGEFQAWLAATHAPDFTPAQQSATYSAAYSASNGSGLEDLEYHYIDYAAYAAKFR